MHKMYLKRKISFVLPVLFCLLPFIIHAQADIAQELSLKEVIEKTMEGNHQLKVANYQWEAAVSKVNGTKAYYLPQVQVSWDLSLRSCFTNK